MIEYLNEVFAEEGSFKSTIDLTEQDRYQQFFQDLFEINKILLSSNGLNVNFVIELF